MRGASSVGGTIRPRTVAVFAVLVLQRFQPFGFRHVKAAILGLPVVERGFRNPMFAGHITYLRPRCVLAQNRYDLILSKPTRPSCRSVSRPRTRRVSAAGLAPISGEVVTRFQSDSSRTDSPVRVLPPQPASPVSRRGVRFRKIVANPSASQPESVSGCPADLIFTGSTLEAP
jgi:hypothetical protein